MLRTFPSKLEANPLLLDKTMKSMACSSYIASDNSSFASDKAMHPKAIILSKLA
jgi:hypothetical protein